MTTFLLCAVSAVLTFFGVVTLAEYGLFQPITDWLGRPLLRWVVLDNPRRGQAACFDVDTGAVLAVWRYGEDLPSTTFGEARQQLRASLRTALKGRRHREVR